MSLVASQSVDVAQLKDALSKLRTNPSKLTMLMQQVRRFEDKKNCNVFNL